jgi:hypothetical protein
MIIKYEYEMNDGSDVQLMTEREVLDFIATFNTSIPSVDDYNEAEDIMSADKFRVGPDDDAYWFYKLDEPRYFDTLTREYVEPEIEYPDEAYANKSWLARQRGIARANRMVGM